MLLVDPDPLSLRGRVRSLASEREATFTQLAELIEFVRAEMTRLEPHPPDSLQSAEVILPGSGPDESAPVIPASAESPRADAE